ncbi:Na+/H+ antiporter NhaC [Rossellomorea vietnamensis]|uniref:Na+/H+ antiporter NhaC n=1 Tax=Rossellomorea vietnamensis TaxID=218284 RepID=UPI001CCD76E0|nr:Na+/H+ antiporter NhaC [Rossellomorea vietnamensis]MCA0148888.1 Na+/H+ antiporter NhaC [Rossellomorea vietnamensis]
MLNIQSVHKPSVPEASAVLLAVLGIISVSIIGVGAVPHIPIILSLFFLMVYGLIRKVKFKEIEKGMIAGAQGGLGAILLFFFIGLLVSSWLISGTIPTLMFYGFEFVTPHYFYAIAFLLTSLSGVAIGSSLTTAATIGVALIGIGEAMGLSMAITAGAIVSGAFFGDKMSPLSDTTNLASSIVKVDLFTHIRNMAWTTVPAFIITLIVFGFLSPGTSKIDLAQLDALQKGLMQTGLIHWYSLVPLVLLVVLIVYKTPALFTLAITIAVSVFLSFFHGTLKVNELFQVLFEGFTSKTGVESVDSLLTRGGVNSMMFTISLVILSLSLGGLLFKLGIIPALLQKVSAIIQSERRTILSTALSAIGINLVVGEQYLSILLTGEAFQSQYKKLGLHPKTLSRTLEDAGTVVNPLVPWSVCGIFLTDVLGVSTMEYLPFAVFCLISPVITILYGFTGWTIEKEPTENNPAISNS